MVRIALLLILASVSLAQSYNFSIPEFNCTVEINPDRSLTISYEVLFTCSAGYHAIDIVDIGFPSDDFILDDVEAGIDNHVFPSSSIYYSSYIDDGVEVHLGQYAIGPGDSGHFRCSGVTRDMVFLDTEDDEFASVEFTPTWFDGGLVSGQSDFTLTVIFPEGAEPDLVRHHDRPFTSSAVDKSGRVVYVWQGRRKISSPYTVGVSFPKDLVQGPLTERPKEPLLSGEALVCVGVLGFVVLVFGLMIFGIVKAVKNGKKRREEYLPPKLGLEGSGVKRGLTAPMAALLLEQKLDRVLMLIIFGLLKKGNLQLEGGKLMRVGSPDGLRTYEKELLLLIPEEGRDKPIPAEDMKKIFLGMIKELEEKMKSFSLNETQQYYKSIIESAWRMVDGDISAERAGEIITDRFQWMLADGKFDRRISRLPESRGVILPYYMYGYFSGKASHSPVGGGAGISLSQACSQVAGALERAAGTATTGITSLTRTITGVTNPVPVATYSSRSGGSGCACACACAGCACACAGGGR